uniref:Uncharacterized protein n=1 Tax=Ditylenchus dipsaci TaxID=166011 RepID=A0A915ENR9_9BILA
MLAGRDKEAKEKGTWFGVNRHGRAGILLSITEPRYLHNAAPSRGLIVPEFLQSTSSLVEYSSDLATKANFFNGFQFLGLEIDKKGVYQLASLTNRLVPKVEPVYWPDGVYGFGNSPRSCPFKKVVHGEKLFQKALDSLNLETCSEKNLIDELLKIGTDDTILFPDEQIQEQTVAKYDEGYKYLCSLFVRFPDRRYGTRSHSILLVDKDDKATFFEKRIISFPNNIEDAAWETTIEQFQIIA